MKKIHYVYKITNLVNEMFYIGKHSTSKIDDGYLGSGRALRLAIAEFGEDRFKKEILGFYDSEDDVLIAERKAIEPYLENVACYNLSPGGGGHLCGENHPSFGKRWRQRNSSMSGKLNGKAIWQFSKDEKFIKKHKSVIDAARSIGKLDHSNIAHAARTGYCAYGFLWNYNGGTPKRKIHGNKK